MKKLLLVSAVAVVGVAGWKLHARHAAPASTSAVELDAQDGGGVLVDRLWLDHLPANQRDYTNFMVILSDEDFGVFQKASMFRGAYEVFNYARQGGSLQLTYPQTRESEKVTVKVRRCKEDGMDFCLDVTGNSRGVQRYYSREDWVIKSLDAEHALADKLLGAAQR